MKRYKEFDPAAKSLAEIMLYPGVRALFFYRIANIFYKARCFFIARLLSELGRSLSGIEIHPGAQIGRGLVIDHGMGVVIGETAVIGDNCVILHNVTLGCKGLHNLKSGKRHPTLRDNVVIGAGAKILGNITIGSRCQIGANAIITESLADDTWVKTIRRLSEQHDLYSNPSETKAA